jgi:regulator of sigma E protease
MVNETIFELVRFIAAIAFLIIVHETGHFVTARLLGIEVDEFGIGFPPRAAKLFVFGGTLFSLNWLPLGGFVRVKGENDPDVTGGLAAANPWARLTFFLSGPTMNILAGIVIFALVFLRLGVDITRVEVVDVANNSPAALADLQEGDIIDKVNGKKIKSTQALRKIIYENLDQQIEMTYLREDQSFTSSIVPRSEPPEGEGAIGILMGNPIGPIQPARAVYIGGIAVFEQTKAILSLPIRFITGAISPGEGRLVGYKGMWDLYTNARQSDDVPDTPKDVNTLSFFGVITISLAILNLLPLPAIDGGRILFTLPEIILRRRVPPIYENIINLVGFAILIGLMIYINLQDFINPINLP